MQATSPKSLPQKPLQSKPFARISRGDLVLAAVPLSKGKGFKTRPVVVLGSDDADLVVLTVSTHAPRNRFDVELLQWRQSGLRKPSTVRCSKNHSIARFDVGRVVGYLSPHDWMSVLDVSASWFTHLIV